MTTTENHDSFGNPIAPGLPYARGSILPDTESDLRKLRVAWEHIRRRRAEQGADSVYLLSGLERKLDLPEIDAALLDDEMASALYTDAVRELGLAHMGGSDGKHDILVTNRLTAGLLLAGDVLVDDGDLVIGVSPRYSHPAVVRAVAHGRGDFHDSIGLAGFKTAVEEFGTPKVVFLTRLAVSYEILPADEIQEIVRIAQNLGATVVLDDAGGGRVGPAIFDQPRSLELGVDVAATGLDKYGTTGPRLGVVGGRADIVAKMRTRAYEMGNEARQMLLPAVAESLKQYSHENVRELVANTMQVADALERRLGAEALFRTPVTVQLTGEAILETAMARAGINEAPIVPYEATAGLAMILLRDHGVVSVHFAGIPPGTAALMIKFLPTDTLARFGGPEKLAKAVDDSFDTLAATLGDQTAYRELLLAPAS